MAGKTHYTDKKPLESFMSLLNDLSVDFEDIDISDKHFLTEYRNYEPKKLIEILIDRAIKTRTSLDNFFDEIIVLISLHITNESSKIEELNNEEVRPLQDLTIKYKVKEYGIEPDIITFTRLCRMFPQYSIPKKMEVGQFTVPDFGHLQGDEIKMFCVPEFGGLIPSRKVLCKDVREGLIIIHLYCLKERKSSIPFRTRQILLKQLMEHGLLTDERRLRYLELKGVLTTSGAFTLNTQLRVHMIKERKIEFVENDIMLNILNGP